MSGVGRGGRGAALLQALNNPVRRPGESGPDSPPKQSPGLGSSQHAAQGSTDSGLGSSMHTAAAPTPAPMGRGAMLLLAKQQSELRAAGTPSSSTAPSPAVAGRGAMLTQMAPPAAGRGAALGRGGALLQHVGARTSPPSPGGDALSRQTPPVQGVALFAQQPARPPSQPQRQQFPGVSSQPTPTPQRASPQQQQQQAPTQAREGEQRGPGRLERMFERVSIQDQTQGPRGNSGAPTPLSVNYIPVRCKNEGVYQYGVNFDPPIDSMGERKKLLYQQCNVLGDAFVFLGSSVGLLIRLPNDDTVLQSVRQQEGTVVNIKLKFTKVVPHEACVPFYASKLRGVMQMLKMCQVGRNFYLPEQSVSVPQHRLEIWPGFVTSIHNYEGGLMLLCDVSHRVLRTETVLNVFDDVQRMCQQRGITDIHREFARRVVGQTVLTRYNNRTYRVDDIAWDMTPQSTFETKSGPISFADYYLKMYSKRVQDLGQPLLIHRPTKTDQIRAGRKIGTGPELLCLVPEFCYTTGLTDEMRSDFRVMKDIAQHTRVTPTRRAHEMSNFVQAILSHPEASKELEKWGLSLDFNQVELSGRLLPPETVFFGGGGGKFVSAGEQADWGRSLDREPVLTPVPLRTWLVLFTGRDRGVTTMWLEKTRQVARYVGIDIQAPALVELPNDRSDTYLRAIKERMSPDVQLVVTVFPTSRDDRYNAVKKLCCVEQPVPSQVIISKTIKDERKLKSVATKILLQMNVKLGGELWALNIPVNDLMVCGIDVYHEGQGGSGLSVAGLVASTSSQCTRWFSQCCFQGPGQELIDQLLVLFIDAIKHFHKENHRLPASIVIFRDGVGDGALKYVSDHELSQLQSAFSKWGDNYQPKFGFIVVQKRINQRIFWRKNRSSLENPGPGTIVDHSITRRDLHDFFLVSQHVRQGTVSPTHYIVLEDSGQWKPDHLQMLSYKLTHLYYNWPGTVRVPAPCQYAHKLAYQVGQNLRKEPSAQLSNRLFYL